jgi:hypothetical protein
MSIGFQIRVGGPGLAFEKTRLPVASGGSQERGFWLYPLHRPPGAPHPRFPVEFRGSPELPAPLLKERRTRGPFQSCVQEIRGISLVFREMWDSTALAPHSHNEADVFLLRPGFSGVTTCLEKPRSQNGDVGSRRGFAIVFDGPWGSGSPNTWR